MSDMTIAAPTKNIKVPFDSLTLRAVIAELRTRLIGGQVQDIRQPSASELRLGIRSQGRSYILALSCDARFARVHLTGRKSANATAPPSFCMALRKHCEGAAIRDIRQLGFDRVVEIEIGARSGEADSATTTLVVELMGKHSNLILVSAAGVVLEAAKRVSHRINRFREILPGVAYSPPPEQEGKLDPFDARTVRTLTARFSESPSPDADTAASQLIEQVAGMSPFLAQNIAVQLLNGEEGAVGRLSQVWDAIFGAAAEGLYHPVAIVSAGHTIGAYPFPPDQISAEMHTPVAELNAALDQAYSAAVTRATAVAAASELKGQIERDRKRLLRQKEIAERTIRESDRAEEYKQCGELILANLWQITPGAAEITVQDYFDPELGQRTLTLDPKLSAQENADAHFKRYRKVRDGQAMAETRRAESEALLAQLNVALGELRELEERGDGIDADVRRLREDLRGRGLLVQHGAGAEDAAAPGPDMQGHKIRRVVTPEGYEIYVGETATANDYLTTRLAASNDLWLHVRSSTSAHVVIKTHGRPEAVPRSVIENAALICARHSSQKHSGLVPVDYTLKKHVRKPRGAAPGSADYHHETTLHVSP